MGIFHHDYYTGFYCNAPKQYTSIQLWKLFRFMMKRKATYKSTQAKSFEAMHAICFTSSLHKNRVDVLANCKSDKAICVVEFR